MRQRSQIKKGLVQIMEETEKELAVEATLDNLVTVLGFVESEAEKAGCPKKETKQLAVAIEELYVNVASYAYTPATGICIVKLQTDRPGGGLGILMVKELVDRLEYMYENGENILSVEKHWQ